MKVCIIDIGMGNLTSVKNAFDCLGCLTSIIRTPGELQSADRIILPGVGAFGDAMDHLNAGGWILALNEEIITHKKPFFGICLGMQVLAERGNEHGSHKGLGWIRGEVERLQGSVNHRIPHIGWDDVEFQSNHKMYTGMGTTRDFYFVHSYVLHLAEQDIVSGICDYNGRFPASIQAGNIWATQYHPEKSQKAGLQVLKNFITSGA